MGDMGGAMGNGGCNSVSISGWQQSPAISLSNRIVRLHKAGCSKGFHAFFE